MEIRRIQRYCRDFYENNSARKNLGLFSQEMHTVQKYYF